MKNVAVTCAVNYFDYFKCFDLQNYKFFDEIYVATDSFERNPELVELCKSKPKYKLFETDKFYSFNNSKCVFNKGGVFTFLMSKIDNPEIITIIDADTLLPDSYTDIFTKLKSLGQFDAMFSAKRYVMNNYNDYTRLFINKDPDFNISDLPTTHEWGWGYLQIFHAKSKWLKDDLSYPEHPDATTCDYLIRLKFGWHIFRQDTEEHYFDPNNQICLKDKFVFHLGQSGENNSKRVTKEFTK